MTAKVIRSGKRVFTCFLTDSKREIEATALATLIKGSEHIVVGDNVELRSLDQKNFEIEAISPRKNEIFRKIVRENKKKIIASNVDLMVIVMSASLPEYKPGLVDRYLLRATQWNIKPIIIFNKWDEKNEEFDWEFEEQKLKNLNVEVFKLSAKFGALEDFIPFKNLLKNKTAIFMGQSGVGKSKLISKINGADIELKSAELAKVGKGAHTTTWAELIICQDFYLIDSPGVRTMAINDVEEDDLINAFYDLHPYLMKCKFSNCKHDETTKGCGFIGVSDPIILNRLESFKRLRLEIQSIPDWEK
jgi:ribosome biogenesis GTPase